MSESGMAAPQVSKHVRALIIWIAVYPTITVLMLALRPWVSDLPLPLATLVLTGVVVPVAAYGIIPVLLRVAASILGRSQ
ncbi:hypothetical protein QSJ18_09030 [Gordonia sp. ABSL1-1]|uniref:hypothetical protein n=1 Tax=Gordonia sp. ABSL1-1 TaxID=3053923 RepID=UPI0025734D48|nr:hypothetical protein [Gordonia sp. ABSL1-1]MDL9936881.1 hypothetical protein [Gordonia sp. ABSL1-1]